MQKPAAFLFTPSLGRHPSRGHTGNTLLLVLTLFFPIHGWASFEDLASRDRESIRSRAWIDPRLAAEARKSGYTLRPATAEEIKDARNSRLRDFANMADSGVEFLAMPQTLTVVLVHDSDPAPVGMIAYTFRDEGNEIRMPVVKAVLAPHRPSGMAAFLQAVALEQRRRVAQVTGKRVVADSSVRHGNETSANFNLGFGYSELRSDEYYRNFALRGEPRYRGRLAEVLSRPEKDEERPPSSLCLLLYGL